MNAKDTFISNSTKTVVRPQRNCKSIYKTAVVLNNSEEGKCDPTSPGKDFVCIKKRKANTYHKPQSNLHGKRESPRNEKSRDKHSKNVYRGKVSREVDLLEPESTPDLKSNNGGPSNNLFPKQNVRDASGETTGDPQTLWEPVEETVNKNSVSQHQDNAAGAKSDSQLKQCPYCQFQYRCPKQLTPHVRTAHPTQITLVQGRLRFKCLYCDDSNTRPRNLVKHMHLSHSSQFTQKALERTKKFKCTEEGCTQLFHREPRLRKHLVVDHGHASSSSRRCDPLRYNIEKLRERAEKVEKGEQKTWGQRADGTKHKASTISTDRHK